jgi:hypothetical protein
VRFEAGLVQSLVTDAGAEPGTLPLLQFALAQLWERQTADLLTHAAYDETGTLSGAITNRAEAVFRSLSSAQHEVARGIVTSLVHLADNGDGHRRRRLPLATLYAQDRLNTDEGCHLLHVLIEARLLTLDCSRISSKRQWNLRTKRSSAADPGFGSGWKKTETCWPGVNA